MVYENAAGRIYGLKCGSGRFWQRTDLPPGSNMLRLAYADSGSACKLAGVQISPLPTLANQILARTFFRSVAYSFAYPAVEKFCRASSAGGRLNLRSNIEQPDRVGRRGLSEPGGIFSRLNTYVFPWLCSRPSLELSTPRRTHRIHQWHSHKRNRKNPSCNQTKNRPQQRKEPDRHQRKQSNARRPHHHRRDRPNRHFVSL